MKKSCVLLSGLLLALNVAGCAGSNRALGEQTPDLVVYNDSTAIIGSITVSSDQESQGVTMADGSLWSGENPTGLRCRRRGGSWWNCGIWMSTVLAAVR